MEMMQNEPKSPQSDKGSQLKSPFPVTESKLGKEKFKTPKDSITKALPTEEQSWEYGSYEDEDDSQEEHKTSNKTSKQNPMATQKENTSTSIAKSEEIESVEKQKSLNKPQESQSEYDDEGESSEGQIE